MHEALLYASAVFVVVVAAVARGLLAKGWPYEVQPATVLLVIIAHPDDEAMFMTPVLLRAAAAGYRLYFLCLSTGNADGKGDTRTAELLESAKYFGADAADVKVLDDALLQDGMRNEWPTDRISSIVGSFCDMHDRLDVLTFDDYGVSGHPNHIAVHLGVVAAHKARRASGKSSRLYLVQSLPLWKKYSGAVSSLLPCASAGGRRCFTARTADPSACARAMLCHWSQMVWYRWLFVFFSRYSFAVDVEVF
ncbi:putative N-acetylglucosaminyl-phosphatidylinositol de-N-acetylase [Diplonema papillatum]|nr:putative N-acetylglucosaminyl-phosphatidylinositol de-N-acetylase [Diplonema papillatum]